MTFDPKAPYQVYYDSITGAKQHVQGFQTRAECEQYIEGVAPGGWLKTLDGEYRLFIATKEQMNRMHREYAAGRAQDHAHAI